MKKLITAGEVKQAAATGEKILQVEPGTIITPAARDVINELNMRLEEVAQPKQPRLVSPDKEAVWKSGITSELIASIVKEVMASLPGAKNTAMIKQADPSGLCLVKGDTVQCEKIDTGKTGDNVGVKEIFTQKETSNLVAGFMTLERTSFLRNVKCAEIKFIFEGTLEITVNGTTYRGEAGDAFFIPKDATVTISAPDKVKLFYITCSTNE